MIKAVIFDVDGVLLDSVPLHFNAWREVFARQNTLITFSDYLEKINGLPRLVGVKNILPSLSEKKQIELAQQKQILLLKNVEEQTPKVLPGVISTIRELKKRNILLASASSSKNSKIFLQKAKIADYFDTIVTGDDFSEPKPNPEIFLMAAKKLHVSPSACIVVEDAFIGLQAAKNAHMYAIGVRTSRDTKLSLFANLVIDSLEEYKKILTLIR